VGEPGVLVLRLDMDKEDFVRLSAFEENILTLLGSQKLYGLEMLEALNKHRLSTG
jgi:hypothetical protein